MIPGITEYIFNLVLLMPSPMPDVHNYPGSELPRPEQEALDHSQRLIDRITSRIYETGTITFAEYMQMALYEPGLGYYSAGSRKIGSEGDFITAPEISPVFSCCLARQVKQILLKLSSPCILEAGPGTGIMAANLLQELQAQDSLPEKYYLLETSAELRQRQQQTLREQVPQIYERLQWLDTLPKKGFSGVIVANEVLDALPFRRVINTDGTWKELCVSLSGTRFSDIVQTADQQLQEAIQSCLPRAEIMADGYTTEICLQTRPWLQSLGDILDTGVLLLFDYGYSRSEYYHPQRMEGSLLCHYRHFAHHDPFLYPGLQDITASVDFTTVAEAAQSAGMQVSGYTTQAHFLMENGLDECLQNAINAGTRERVDTMAAVRTLTMPGEMGERVKCMALTKNPGMELTGFRTFDQRYRL